MNNLVKRDITLKMKFITPTDVKRFTWVANECKGDVDCLEANRNVSGKSILGVLSMALSDPITVVFHDVYGNEEFLDKLQEWVVE